MKTIQQWIVSFNKTQRRDVREALDDLSLKVFGTKSRWKKFSVRGIIQEVQIKDDKGEVKTVKRLVRPTLLEICKYMLEQLEYKDKGFKAEMDEMRAKNKKKAEETSTEGTNETLPEIPAEDSGV